MFPRKKKKKNDKVTIETEWNGIIKMESTAKENEMIKDGDVSRFILTVEISFRNSSLSRVTRKIHRVQTWYRILLMYQILFYLLHTTTVVAPRAFHRSSGHESGKETLATAATWKKFDSGNERTPKSGHVILFVLFGSSTIENFGDLGHDGRVYDFLNIDEQDKRIDGSPFSFFFFGSAYKFRRMWYRMEYVMRPLAI